MEEIRLAHQEELFNHASQHQKELDRLKDFHQQESNKYQQDIDQLLVEIFFLPSLIDRFSIA